MGDPASIGPEITVKAQADQSIYEACRPIVVGDACVLEAALKIAGHEEMKVRAVKDVRDAVFTHGTIDVLDMGLVSMDELVRGQVSAMCGDAAFRYVEKVIELAMDGQVDATVTNAFNKEAVNLAGHHYSGHTEIYADLTGTKNYTMMLAHENMRVVHVSTHVSLREACKKEVEASRVADVEEIAGHGIMAKVDGRTVCVGNSRLMERQNVNWLPCELPGTIVHVTIDGFYAGHIVISDLPKPDAKEAIAGLKALGVKKTVMLTGDAKEVAHTVADALGLDEYHAELLPADKVARVEELLKQETGKLAFVGDGINDAPVLTRADIGIAMGGLGSDAAIEAADIVLMDDKPSKLADAIRIARRTLAIVRQNIVFALAVKFLVLALSAAGVANMWEAVFADVGVSVIAILNAMRALKTVK